MNEPATSDDVERAKNAILARINEQNTATRAHLANEVATVRNDVGFIKSGLARLLKAIKRFLTKHGVNSDDL